MQAWIEVDLGAISRNVDRVKQKIGKTVGVIAVVKSNAYGHGLEKVVETLDKKDVEMFAVISIEEADRVRRVSKKPILILGYLDTKELIDAIEEGYRVSLYDVEQIALYQRAAERLGKTISVHLKVETGLNRLGFSAEQTVDFLLGQRQYPNIRVEALFSHLADASSVEKNEQQLRVIQDILIDIEGKVPLLPIHFDSSYALTNFPQGYLDAVRIGLALYGIDEVLPGLESSFTCKSVVMQVKKVAAGEGVSYGHLYHTKRDTKIAVIAIGYADGLSQVMRDKLTVLIQGSEVPVIGQICMNMIIADVTDITAKRGDEVVIIGSQKNSTGETKTIKITDIAKRCALRHHEIITRLGTALPKRYYG